VKSGLLHHNISNLIAWTITLFISYEEAIKDSCIVSLTLVIAIYYQFHIAPIVLATKTKKYIMYVF